MTYEEWLATERRHADLTEVENAFGYTPDNVESVVSFSPGLAVILSDGRWYTHVDRSEVSGTADEVRQYLWKEYADIECNGGK